MICVLVFIRLAFYFLAMMLFFCHRFHYKPGFEHPRVRPLYFWTRQFHEHMKRSDNARKFFIFLVIILPVYYYTGRSAMIVASGKKKKFLYLFIAMFLLFWKFSYILQTFDPGDKPADDSLTASLLVNLTCCITLIDLIISTISVYICRSRLKRK